MRISDWSSDVCSSDLPLKQQQRSEGPDEKGHDLFLAVRPKRFEGGDQDDNDIGIFDGDTDGSGHVSIGSAAKQHKRYQQIYRHQHRDRQMPCTNDEQANGHNGYRDKRISGQSGSERLEHVDMVGPANITDPERCDKEPSGQAANAISRDEQRHEQQQCCGCKNPKSERWGETFCRSEEHTSELQTLM